MASDKALSALADERFVSLSTFRKTGVAVPTPVWIARDGDALIVTTPRESGKVKRLHNNPAVELSPCSRGGRVPEGAPTVAGVASIVTDESEVARLGAVFNTKYTLEYKIFMLIERLGRSGQKKRVMLRITSA